MAARALSLVAVLLLVAACGTRLNPLNWFGGAQEETIDAPAAELDVDPRGLVEELVDLRIDPLPGGALITAIGRAATQGYWAASLVEVSREDGRLTYEFRIAQPPAPAPSGPPQSREVSAVVSVTDGDLQGVRQIVVTGRTNRLTASR